MLTVKWPSTIPCQARPQDGWLWPDVRFGFEQLLSRETRLYVELGSWCGASAKLAAELAPNARLICIDTWDGRSGRQRDLRAKQSLSLFQANLWEHRHRVDMLRLPTTTGVERIADAGLGELANVVYIDADQRHATAEVLSCKHAFPHARICGNGYDDSPGVAAVAAFGESKVWVGHNRKFWWVTDAD